MLNSFIKKILSVLCRYVLRYLTAIDPGYTPTQGQFILEANKSKMALSKMDLDEGLISRVQFLKRLKDGVQVCKLLR